MTVDSGDKYVYVFKGGFQWYMTSNNDFISNISFRLKIEHGNLVSFIGQTFIFVYLSRKFISFKSQRQKLFHDTLLKN